MSTTPAPEAPAPALATALDRLVGRGVITPEQAAAVLAEVGPPPDAGPPAPASPHASPPAVATQRPATTARAHVVEAAAYLGGVLVAASAVAFLAQSWEDMTESTRLLLLGLIGVLAYAGGLLAARTAGGRVELRRHEHASRRRVSGTLMALGSVLLALLTTEVLHLQDERAALVGGLTGLALLALAEVLAPSAVTEIGLLGATLLVVGVGTSLLIPDRAPQFDPYGTGTYQPSLEEVVVPVALAVAGVLWGAVVARWLTLPVLAAALGSAASLVAGAVLVTSAGPLTPGVVLLGSLAAAGTVLFLVSRSWPWIVLAVLAVTVLVFSVVAEQSAPALAFLVAGLVLLAGAVVAALLGRRARPPGAGTPVA
ncbi:MAG: DUF2157 domain-containing protein [Frankiales bacterium]|nr:DUF2157 domain-containing protein [Frankiales bacterium]